MPSSLAACTWFALGFLHGMDDEFAFDGGQHLEFGGRAAPIETASGPPWRAPSGSRARGELSMARDAPGGGGLAPAVGNSGGQIARQLTSPLGRRGALHDIPSRGTLPASDISRAF